MFRNHLSHFSPLVQCRRLIQRVQHSDVLQAVAIGLPLSLVIWALFVGVCLL